MSLDARDVPTRPFQFSPTTSMKQNRFTPHKLLFWLIPGVSIMAIALLIGALMLPSFHHAAHALSTNTAEDNFQRANTTAGWGATTNADSLANYSWQRSLSNSVYTYIQSGTGAIQYTGTNGHKAAGFLYTAPQQSGDVLAKIAFSNIGGAEGGVNLDNDKYGTRWYQADMNTALNTLELRKRFLGKMTTVASIPFIFTPNTTYWLRIDVQVSNGVALVKGRAWLDGTSEPTTWQITYTDAAPLPSGYPGAMGDWFRAPPAGTLTRFLSWSYAANGLAVPAK